MDSRNEIQELLITAIKSLTRALELIEDSNAAVQGSSGKLDNLGTKKRQMTNRGPSSSLNFLDNALKSQSDLTAGNLDDERWLTTSEAAEFLRITTSSLFTLCNRGKIPYYKFGRKNRFRESELKRLLMENPRGILCGR